MTIGILGKKLGMTQLFLEDGTCVPVTVVQAGPCKVLQVKAAAASELPDEERERIKEVARSQPGVQGVHDLRTRSSGAQVFIQMHVEIDGDLPLREAHEIADRVEIEVGNAFPNAEVIVHQDPDDIDEDHFVPR